LGIGQQRRFTGSRIIAEWRCSALDITNSVNARGPFLMTGEIGRGMVAAGHRGRIVNVASAALIASVLKGLGAYTSSKGALLALSQASAFELAEHGITVTRRFPAVW
jgi:NAD(P)-dependent dehydrogenase (short-subunit alcohol dehydrogenase family)